MRIGLIDVDGYNYPNLALMKLSAYHKKMGDVVEWYIPFTERYDIVNMSKVFSFTSDYAEVINADKVVKGGTGYAITLVDGREVFNKNKDVDLPQCVEEMMPDYSIYPSYVDTAYGYLTRGCPRGCLFCVVKDKEGSISVKVANLSHFWRGQKKIVLMDPNILACKDRVELLVELADSGAIVDINQGLDARLLDDTICELLANIKMKLVHFAWDRYEDKNVIVEKLQLYKKYRPKMFKGSMKAVVYMIVNFNTTFEQDLDRVYTLRELGYAPYVMIYDKQHAADKYRKLARWVNCRWIFMSCSKFEDYKA